jgi:hypothetical protein|tara:strand:- start:8020 stop:8190 length:171 start_codon:yes stop_codon:yes gene_type:complete
MGVVKVQARNKKEAKEKLKQIGYFKGEPKLVVRANTLTRLIAYPPLSIYEGYVDPY